MHTIRAVCCLSFCISITGCVSTKTSGVADTAQFQQKTVALTDRPRAAFMAGTAGKAMFGLIGVLAMEETGRTIVSENAIADPAVTVSRTLLEAAEKRYGVIASAAAPVRIDTTDVAQLAHAAQGSDFLLDVQSYGQSIMFAPNDLSHYWVLTTINVRVINVPQAKLIAEGHCAPNTKDDPNPPTYDELMANKAARLKSILDAQSAECAMQFKRDVLKISE